MGDVLRRLSENVDGVLIEAVQDVEPYLDRNKARQNDGTNGYTPSRDLRKIADIPLVVAELWMNLYGVDVFNKDHAGAIRRLLRSSDWAYLRTVAKV